MTHHGAPCEEPMQIANDKALFPPVWPKPAFSAIPVPLRRGEGPALSHSMGEGETCARVRVLGRDACIPCHGPHRSFSACFPDRPLKQSKEPMKKMSPAAWDRTLSLPLTRRRFMARSFSLAGVAALSGPLRAA